MYELIIEKPNGESIHMNFESFSDMDDYITENWNDEWEWLVPCAYGGWIDYRDCF